MTSSFTQLPLAAIRTAPRYGGPEDPYAYQRRHNDIRTTYMSENWDEDLYEPIVVVRADRDADGTEYVAINGNHRLMARKKLADRNGETKVQLAVHLLNGGGYTTPQEQAALFRKSNSRDMRGKRTTQPLSAREDYHAGIVALDPECVNISALMARHGLEVVSQANAHGCSITALQWVYKRAVPPMEGAELLGETLTVLTTAWPDPSSERHHRGLVVGLGAVLREAMRQKKYHRKRFLRALDDVTPAGVIDMARARTTAINAEATWAAVLRDVALPSLEVDGWEVAPMG